MRLRAAHVLGLVLLLTALCGCSFTYTEVGTDVPDTDRLEIGVSTTTDALERLGPPRIVRKQFDGELFTYRRVEHKRRSLTILPIFVKILYVAAGEQLSDDVSLLFDRKGVLRGIGTRLESEQPEEEEASNRLFLAEALRRIGDLAYWLVR